MCSYFVVNIFLLMSVVRKMLNIKVTLFLIAGRRKSPIMGKFPKNTVKLRKKS